jgi:hypothetical protein
MYDITKSSQEMKNFLLARLKSDCEYYLNYGNRSSNVLWSKEEKSHIEDMKILYNSLEENPNWITMEDINKYGELMGVNNND